MLVADCNDFPIGNLFIQLTGDQQITDGRRRAYFYSLRVMDMFQGQGIGTSLIREAEQMALQYQLRWATIAASMDNPRARRLYERLGYKVIAEDDGKACFAQIAGLR